MSTLENETIERRLNELDGWKRSDAKTIERTFSFDEFLTGISFVDKVAEYAEEVQHHPHVTIDHTTITIRYSTHDQGGITEKDMSSAAACNRIFDETTS
ncbi:4a-hydroxytetrahydrobiopterin dehydratase [Salibacterium halotolerans]|uniref:Putative pterin-4-alpha-carbinolamine dehydratase n=1 Tax=Salibacterium halotolerans TaxID=1884432 RepID=A0A1I5T4P9_9BACI|nr:4a-hydroxytetrahydrobiopterin dehydratase [Salibacterium halotolerans]SFP78010.1 4a-hydroxytetrahydrobiopterin dehydratase [Salibacterium halotolerans]